MTTYWIDQNRGNDSNSGESRSKPWRNLAKLESIRWSPGDAVHFADDSEWYLSGRTTIKDCNGTADKPIVFTRYSASGGESNSYPILRARYVPKASEWQFDQKVAAWYLPEPNNAPLPDVQGFGVFLLGPEKEHGMFVRSFRDPLTPLTKPRQWSMNPATRRYYIYSPRDINPTDYYGGVIVGIPAAAHAPLLFQRCGTHVHLSGLKFQECGNGVTVGLYFGARSDVVGFSMTDCVGFNVGSLVYLASDYTAKEFEHVIRRPIIARNRIERCATSGIRLLNTADIVITENSGSHATGRSWAIGFVYVDSANDHPRTGGGLVAGNHFAFAGHGTEYPESDNTFDGAAIYCEAGSRDLVVRGNLVTDCHTAFQDNSGRAPGNTWTANIADRCGRGIVITDADSVATGHTRFLHNLCVLDGGRSVMHSAKEMKGAVRRALSFTGTGADRAMIANNILLTRTPATFGVQVNSSLTYSVRNNIVSGFKIPLSDLSGVAMPLDSSNSIANPLLVDAMQPQLGLSTDSPARASGMALDNQLDYFGRSYGDRPNMGPWAVLPK